LKARNFPESPPSPTNNRERPLAVCPDSKNQLKNCRRETSLVVDLKHVPELKAITFHPAKGPTVRAAAPYGVPVTIKTRIGIDHDHQTFLDAGRIAEESGCAAIALHGRTAQQAYAGEADWNAISALKAHVSIPVLGNGDIWEAADALQMIRQTGVDGVVVGRRPADVDLAVLVDDEEVRALDHALAADELRGGVPVEVVVGVRGEVRRRVRGLVGAGSCVRGTTRLRLPVTGVGFGRGLRGGGRGARCRGAFRPGLPDPRCARIVRAAARG